MLPDVALFTCHAVRTIVLREVSIVDFEERV